MNNAIHNLQVWARRFNVTFDTAKAQETLDRVFPGSAYLGPLALVLRKVIRDRSTITDDDGARNIAYYVACGLTAVSRGEFTSGEHALTIMAKALEARNLPDAQYVEINCSAMRYSLEAVALFTEALQLRAKSNTPRPSGSQLIANMIAARCRGY